MHLKKLVLLGFKSFPELTEVEFGPGMTGVVGPNGCGKTNILDALRWVLGEQRSSALRSGKMEEIIFNGSRDAKPLGMSEVSLTIANSRGVLPTEYTDLTITRRLYRSGESEYMMNRQPCRLRDILDLFADTGMGAHSYSVIQQDMIDAVLSDKDEERRFLFDEAAGITKYKHRKRAALRKLDATDADLLRLQDIAAEVRTRVNSLKRQSNKARRFTETREAWQELYLRLAWSDYESLQGRVRTQTTRAAHLNSDLDAARARVAVAEARRDALQTQVDSVEQSVEEARVELSVADRQQAELTASREKATAENHALEERQREFTEELELLGSRKREFEVRVSELQEQLTLARVEVEQAQSAGAEREASRSQADTHWQQAKGEQHRAQDSADEARNRSRQIESELVHAETTLVSICESLTQAEEALDASEREVRSAVSEREEREEHETVARDTLHRAENDPDAARIRHRHAREELHGAEETLAEGQTALTEIESKRAVLENWIETYRGYQGAVPDLRTRDRIDGIEDTVAEIISPASGFELAVGAALAERAEYLVCRDRRTAAAAMTRLEQSDVGRATLIVLDAIAVSGSHTVKIESARPLVSVTSARRGFERLREFLLGDFYLWEGTGDPPLTQLPRSAAFVTRTGRLHRGEAEVAAGKPAAAGLLARKDELEHLAQEVGLQEQLTQQTRTKVADLRSQAERLAAQIQTSETQLKAAQEQYRSVSLEAERARARADSSDGNLERDRKLCAALRERVGQTRDSIGQFKQTRETAEAESKDLQSLAERSKSTFEFSEQARTEAILKSGEAQVHEVSLRGRADGLESDRERTQEMLADVISRIASHTTQLEESGQRREALKGQFAQLAARRQSVEADRIKLDSVYKKAREGSRDLLTQLQEIEVEVKAARKTADEVGGHHHAAEMAASEARLEVSNLCDRVRDTHNRELSEQTDLRPIEEGQRGLVAAEVLELKEKMDRMGTVNLLALEEYDEQKERIDFLDQQLADMAEAKKMLLETIGKINDTARDMFSETFDKVQQNFNELFSRLFEGGEARVTLDVPEDPLESPIAIMAKPRGKRPVSILQLSGGERALTAIALLFSLYLVKPSPFCILDEIDAPLDDANIGRFLDLLARFATDTQFIIITHNKMTMQAADVIYGVTMESPGISKTVAVKLNEAVEVAGVA